MRLEDDCKEMIELLRGADIEACSAPPISTHADTCMECGEPVELDAGWCDECYRKLEELGFFEVPLRRE